MRRLLATMVLSLLLGGLLLATPRPAAAQEDTLAKIKRTGAMTIGFRESSPPFSFVAANDPKPQGYSIDLCLRIVEGI
jgi:glutamate/aspartate transport system substrate-binding protein